MKYIFNFTKIIQGISRSFLTKINISRSFQGAGHNSRRFKENQGIQGRVVRVVRQHRTSENSGGQLSFLFSLVRQDNWEISNKILFF